MKKEQLLDLISGRYPEGLARWHLKLSKWNAPDEEKAALSRLFSSCLITWISHFPTKAL